MDAAERLKSLLANTLYLHQCFLDALNENEGVMDGTLLFSKIRRTVMPNSDQTPEYSDIRKYGHDGGDFLFVRQCSEQ